MKFYQIELSEKNATILMMQYDCREDAELRRVFQNIIDSRLPRDLEIELHDKVAMQEVRR